MFLKKKEIKIQYLNGAISFRGQNVDERVGVLVQRHGAARLQQLSVQNRQHAHVVVRAWKIRNSFVFEKKNDFINYLHFKRDGFSTKLSHFSRNKKYSIFKKKKKTWKMTGSAAHNGVIVVDGLEELSDDEGNGLNALHLKNYIYF